MRGRIRAGCLQQLERARQVRRQIGVGRLDRMAHPGLGGQVDYNLRPVPRHDVAQEARRLDLAAQGQIGRELGQPCLSGGLERRVLVGVVVVDADHASAFGQ